MTGGAADLRPASTLLVDHEALRHNLAILREHCGAQFMAVIKANGFNLGATEVAETVLAAGVTWLGVAHIHEALALRADGITAPVLAWLIDPYAPIADALAADVTLSIANRATLDAIVAAAQQADVTADVHVQLDTEIGRGGADRAVWGDLLAALAEAERAGNIRVTGLWSHLARASEPDPSAVSVPVAGLSEGLAMARDAGLNPELVHLASSAAALVHPDTHFDLVRIGASMYGVENVYGREFGLRMALGFRSHVTQLHRVTAGFGVGYDHRYRPERDTTLAVVPVGYADGVPRTLGGRGEVTIRGRRFPIVGTVSMDQIIIDIADEAIKVGDEVILLGDRRNAEPDVAEWARWDGTIEQDIMTALGRRSARVHLHR